jgi:MiaB-like tRNA modifying enzyme
MMKIYFESYGCTLNKSEAGLYVNSLLKDGSTLVDNPADADLSVISTCVVIKHTENRMLSRIQELSSKSKVRVMGCLPPVSAGTLESDSIEVLHPREMRAFYYGALDDIEIREPSIFDGIPINQGCTGNCNFCISRVARGKLISRPVSKIASQVRMQIERGIGEVRISSLDTAAYGKDTGVRLPNLIREICSIEGDFMLRVGMMEPRNTFEIVDDLLNSYSDPKVFRFLHLPVQSGDDRILESMNREYKLDEFLKITEKFRNSYPDGTLSTDIISGYPEDDEESFQNTLNMLERTKPEIVNITRFSPRQYTKDFNRKVPDSGKVKRWTAEYTEMHRNIIKERMENLIGRTESIFLTERVKDGTTMGRDQSYRAVVVPGEHPLYSRIDVELVDHGGTYLIGKPLI